jgi:hypothetical protein
MPTFVAMLIASLAAWLVEGPVRATIGPLTSMAVSLLLAAVVFFFAKRFVSNLRGSS